MKLEDAHRLAIHLLSEHRLSQTWSFKFDRSKVRFGKCSYATRQISLSRYLVQLNTEREVRDTILHEIAHALAPRGAGHGPVWQRIARAIGCEPKRCYGTDVTQPQPKFRGMCPTCHQVVFRHRRSMIACGVCSPVFDPRHLFQWSET